VPTPTNRVPVRVARGNYATFSASMAELYEGEIVYAVDEQALYVVENETLIPVAGDGLVLSVNGQTGNVILGVGELDDTDLSGLADGDMLVYQNNKWINIPATTGGTVYSVDVTGSNGISSTGGPITSTGSIDVSLTDTGVVPGEYIHPKVTVDAQGRISSIEAEVPADQTLNDLTDVEAPVPGIGDGLVWDGVNWINTPDVGGGAGELDELTDVDVSTTPPLNGQALVYNQGSATWVPGTVDTAEPPPPLLEIDDLIDVVVDTSLTSDYILRYSQQANVWENVDLVLDTIEDIADVQTGLYDAPANGDVLVWDVSSQKWTNRPANTAGPVELQTYTTDSTASPLLGGDSVLADNQAWNDLGFVLFSPLYDPDPVESYPFPRSEGYSQAMLLSDLPDNYFKGQIHLWGGYVENIPTVNTSNALCQIHVNREMVALSKPVQAPNYYTSYYDCYDYREDGSNDSQIEFSLFAEDVTRLNMLLGRVGLCPLYVDADGEKWSIVRREYFSQLTYSRHFAQEFWLSSKGSFFVKQGAPSWGFNWNSGNCGEYNHGVYFDGNSENNDSPNGLEGYGYKNWADRPRRGSYVNFCGPKESGPILPSYRLEELENVEADNAVAQDIIQYDGTNWVNTPLPPTPEVPQDIGDLDDVDTTGAQPDEILIYDGSSWKAEPLPSSDIDLSNESIDALGDVNTSNPPPGIGQLLQYNGFEWVPADAPQSGAGSLDDLTDVNVVTPAPEDTQVLAYNQADDEWQAANPRATSGAPTATNFPGLPGEMRFDAEYFYICIALNTWKQVALSDITSTPEPPVIGDIADGGDFLNGNPGTIDTILDGGNWTTGVSNDQQDVVMDGGLFGPDLPVIGDAIDGGNFEDGTSNGTNFFVDGGNFTTGAPGTDGGIDIDGGEITPDLPQNGDIIDGGDWLNGTPGTNYYTDGGNFTTGAAGSSDVTLDGGYFEGETPDSFSTIDGGNFEFGFSNGSEYYMDGGNWTTGLGGSQGTADGGLFEPDPVLAPGPNDTINGGNFTSGVGGSNFNVDGGSFITGDSIPPQGTADGGVWTSDVDLYPVEGGNFTTGQSGARSEIVDGGQFTTGDAYDETPVDGGDFTLTSGGNDEGTVDGGEFIV